MVILVEEITSSGEEMEYIFPLFLRIHGSWHESTLFEDDCDRSKVFARALPSAKEFGDVGESQPINTWRRTADLTKDPKPVGLQQSGGTRGQGSGKAGRGREELLTRVLQRRDDSGGMGVGGKMKWSSSARPAM